MSGINSHGNHFADYDDNNKASPRSSTVTGDELHASHNNQISDSQPQPSVTHDVEKQAPQQDGGKPTHHVNDISSVPNGGALSWLQVVGSFFLFFNTWGIVNTYGVYATYYSLEIIKDTSESNIAWIGSIQSFLLLIIGMLTGPIYDMGYFRPLLLVGSFMIIFGHMMLSLCTAYWQFLLAQSFCIGIGMGLLFVPSVAILSTYFTTHLALATGIAASGSSLGGVIYPIVLHRLLPQIGFPWAVRVIGFMTLATLLLPNLCMKVRVLPAQRRKLLDLTAFKSLPYVLFCLGAWISFCGLYVPFFFVQQFTITKNLTSQDFAFYLLSILNAASICGRIVPNFFADTVGPLNVIAPCAIMSGVLIFCLLAVHNLGGIVIFVLFFGFFSGSLVSLPPTVVVSLTPDRRFIGTRLGMAFAFIAFGVLIGSPIGGVILREKGFVPLWIFGGVLSVAGGLVLVMARVAYKGWKPFVKA